MAMTNHTASTYGSHGSSVIRDSRFLLIEITRLMLAVAVMGCISHLGMAVARAGKCLPTGLGFDVVGMAGRETAGLVAAMMLGGCIVTDGPLPIGCWPESDYLYVPVGPDEQSRLGVTPREVSSTVPEWLAFHLTWHDSGNSELSWSEVVEIDVGEVILADSKEIRFPKDMAHCNIPATRKVQVPFGSVLRLKSGQLEAEGILHYVRRSEDEYYYFEAEAVWLGSRYAAYASSTESEGQEPLSMYLSTEREGGFAVLYNPSAGLELELVRCFRGMRNGPCLIPIETVGRQ